MFAFFGCSKQNTPQINVSITDGRCISKLSVNKGDTVESVLEQAELKINKNDDIKPSLDSKLEKDTKIKINRSVTVKLVYEGEKEYTMKGKKVGDIIKKAGLDKEPHLYVNYENDVFLSDVEGDIVAYKKNQVTVVADGNTKTYLTAKKTVREVLEECKIKLGKNDRVSADLDAKIEEGTKIVVNRVKIETVEVTESIPYSTRTEKTSSMYVGQTKVKTNGVNGQKIVTYKITYVDGVIESKVAVGSKVVKDAVAKVVLSGTKAKPVPTTKAKPSKHIVSKVAEYDCDGSGHGYYTIRWSDGSVTYQDF